MKQIQPRWKSKILWTAVIAQIMALAGMLGLWDALGISSDMVQGVLSGILELFVIFGVINDPTNKAGM